MEDMDVVVAEIVSVMAEVPVVVVDASPAEDMVVIIMLLTLLILKRVFLVLLKDVALLDVRLLKVLQVIVVDKVVMWLILLAVMTTLPVLSGDGRTILPVVIGDVKVVVDLPFILPIVWTSARRVKVTLIKDTRNITTLMGKNSATMNNRNITARKVRQNKENSVMQKLENKKRNKLWTLIGLTHLASQISC